MNCYFSKHLFFVATKLLLFNFFDKKHKDELFSFLEYQIGAISDQDTYFMLNKTNAACLHFT